VNSGALQELSLATLDSVSVNEIDLMPDSDRIVLSTNNGVFIVEGDRLLQAGMQGETITNLVILDEQTMLLSIPSNGENGVTTLFRTTNGGRSWSGFMRNWGGEEQISAVSALTIDPTNQERLFGRAMSNVARSLDGGRSWESVRKNWTTFGLNSSLLKINPHNPDQIWAGGTNAVFQPVLFKSENRGENWMSLRENLQILDVHFEGNVFDVVFSSEDSNTVMVTLGSVFKSTDSGNTWNLAEESNVFLRFMASSSRSAYTVYASGQNQQGTLFYAVTRNFGDTWETIEVPDTPSGISVNDLAVVERGGRDVLLFGTNNGFFRVPVEEN